MTLRPREAAGRTCASDRERALCETHRRLLRQCVPSTCRRREHECFATQLCSCSSTEGLRGCDRNSSVRLLRFRESNEDVLRMLTPHAVDDQTPDMIENDQAVLPILHLVAFYDEHQCVEFRNLDLVGPLQLANFLLAQAGVDLAVLLALFIFVLGITNIVATR
jgi:hypothetical protein